MALNKTLSRQVNQMNKVIFKAKRAQVEECVYAVAAIRNMEDGSQIAGPHKLQKLVIRGGDFHAEHMEFDSAVRECYDMSERVKLEENKKFAGFIHRMGRRAAQVIAAQ
jgi:hypothetical protein